MQAAPFEKLWRKFKAVKSAKDGKITGVIMASIDPGESEAAIEDFAKHYNITHPVLIDSDYATMVEYGATSWPHTIIIDENSRVRYRGFIGAKEIDILLRKLMDIPISDAEEALVKEARRERSQTSQSLFSAKSPKVVSTSPENGAKDVDPNVKEIKVTFSTQMGRGYSWVRTSAGYFPETTGRPYWQSDATCVLPVKLKPGTTYTLQLNSSRYTNFKDRAGNAAIPYKLEFTTRRN